MQHRLLGCHCVVGLSILCASAAPAVRAGDCPACTDPEDSVIDPEAAQLSVAMKWCGVAEATSMADPSVVCEDNFKDVLWRRHERASECIYIPQCRITLRSAGAVQKEDYSLINDMRVGLDDDTGIEHGDAGDLTFPYDLSYLTELMELWMACDEEWENQPKGLLVLSVNNFLNPDGSLSGASGVALSQSGTRPWIAVEDPTTVAYGPDSEQLLAHEVGHALGLPHVGMSGNVMLSNVNGRNLTIDQCDTMRDVIMNTEGLDGRGARGGSSGPLVDFARDALGEFANFPLLGFLDIYKILAIDRSEFGGGLVLTIGTDGLFPEAFFATYYVALDIDNDDTTGLPAARLVPGSAQSGVELVIRIMVSSGKTIQSSELFEAQNGAFVLVDDDLPAQVRTALLSVCTDSPPSYTTPMFEEIEAVIPPETLDALGLINAGGPLFPDGLSIQAASRSVEGDGGVFMDYGPDAAGKLDFPDVDFPDITVDNKIARGSTIEVTVNGLTPNLPVKVFVAGEMILPGEMTDGSGDTTFDLTLPDDLPLGPTLLTVGVDHPTNAVTADAIVSIFDNCPDLTGDDAVGAADVAEVLGAWGEAGGPADIDGSGLVDGLDLALVLAGWGPC